MSESPFAPPPEPDGSDGTPDFREPWNPGHLMLLTFFGGLLTGGYLLFRNLERLGIQAGSRKILIVSIAYAVVVIGVGSYLAVDRAQKRQREETMAKLLGDSDREANDSAPADRDAAAVPTTREPDGSGAEPDAEPRDASPDSAEGEGEASTEEERSLAELLELDDASMEEKRDEDRRFRFLVRNIFAVGAVLIAWALARPQFPRFQWAMSEGHSSGKLFLPAVGVIAVSWVIELVGVAIGVMIFVSL